MKNQQERLYIMLFILIIVALMGCNGPSTQDTIDWINTHEKPIICHASTDKRYIQVWTMVDANGTVWITRGTAAVFPDTIKSNK